MGHTLPPPPPPPVRPGGHHRAPASPSAARVRPYRRAAGASASSAAPSRPPPPPPLLRLDDKTPGRLRLSAPPASPSAARELLRHPQPPLLRLLCAGIRTDEEDERQEINPPPASPTSPSAVPVRQQPRAGDTSSSSSAPVGIVRRLAAPPPPRAFTSISSPSTSSSPGGMHLDWSGPGIHRFRGMEDLLLSVGDLNRFLVRREELCILQNARHFLNNGEPNDASDDPRRRDFDFLVVSRRTLLDMAARAGVVESRFWPGYKQNYYELSEERRISTLKLNENTFLWRHEVSGSHLLRRRISLDSDEGPFEDDTNVFYILQYQKLPRMKKSKKAAVLAARARNGYF